MRRAAKRDISEPDIVKALRDAGYWVHLYDEPTDLMVGKPGRCGVVFMEVKNTLADRFTDSQIEFFTRMGGWRCARVHTPDEALRVAQAELGETHGGSDG